MNEIDIILHCLKGKSPRSDKPVMLDVGGHFGESAEKFLGLGWFVHVFEPDEKNFCSLKSSLHRFPDASLSRLAVSDSDDQTLPWYRSEESTGISGLSAFRETHRQVDEVETISLKTYVKKTQLKKVEFLKIDAEGFDLFVLRGYDWSSPSLAPRAIICEFEDRKTLPLGYTWDDMAAFLQSKGYRILVSEWLPIERYGVRHTWKCFKRYPCQLDNAEGWGNLLCFRDPADFNRACGKFKKAFLRKKVSDQWKRSIKWFSRS